MSTLRDLGNEHFKAGQFKEAETLYTQAIAEHSRADPKVFANRSLTRIRLSDFSSAESDARKAIELYGSKNHLAMKAHYYLAQALLAQRHYSEALIEAKTAYAVCLETKDSSAELIGGFILKCKQERWKGAETRRLRERDETLAYVEGVLDRELERDLAEVEERFGRQEIGDTGRREEREQIEQEASERRENVRRGFVDRSQPESEERVVPDWLVDPITFEVMHDPVITPTGVSYERVGLLKHIKAVGFDPLTRAPLRAEDLIPNVGLKNAAAEFLDKNGWAVDW